MAGVTLHIQRLERMSMKLKRYAVELDVSGLKIGLNDMKDTYETLESEYYSIVDAGLEEEEMTSVHKSFGDITKVYLDAVKAAKKVLKDCGVSTVVNAPMSPSDADLSVTQSQSSVGSELANALTLPKISIPAFSGNPAEYKLFISLFDEAVAAKVSDNRSKLTYLSTFVKGEALQAIRPMLAEFSPDSYERARKVLHERFGDSFLTTQVLLTSLTQGKKVVNAHGLRQLADELAEVLCVLGADLKSTEADSQSFFLGVLARCPGFVKNQWSKNALDVRKKDGRYPCFKEFVSFMKDVATRISDPVYGMSQENSAHVKTNMVRAASPHDQSATRSAQRACALCAGSHGLMQCPDFIASSVEARYDVVRSNRLCYRCLKYGHFAQECFSRSVCGVAGCRSTHHELLHRRRRNEMSQSQNPADAASQNTGQASLEANHVRSAACNGARATAVCLPVIAVMVQGVRINALLDNGSTHTLVSRSLVNELSLSGEQAVCRLETVNGSGGFISEQVSLEVRSCENDEKVVLKDVLVVNDIPALVPPRNIDLSKYPHLANLTFPRHDNVQDVRLLIGMDHPELLVPCEVRVSDDPSSGPYACRTRLGWALQGPLSDSREYRCRVNFVKCDITDKLNDLWALEREGDDDVAPSVQDNHVVSLWERETKFEGGHYEVPVPWREGCPRFPDNEMMARRRLHCTLKKMERENKLYEYGAGIKDMIDQGYAEPVPVEDLPSGKTWYLPHHAVVHPVKKKLRIVFDCAAKQNDVSLNNSCLSGPDLTSKLLHVLLRFREYPVAVTADVKAMYMQVRLPEKDRNSLRFLWKQGNEIVQYRMCSHVFGGVWCAASSTFALRRCLSDFQCSDAARESVEKGMYVDDLLVSRPDVETAQLVAKDTKQVLGDGGFLLTKFTSNVRKVLEAVPERDQAEENKVIVDDVSTKVLGLTWNKDTDTFTYQSSIHCNPLVTKRSMLSAVASLYDPLGLVAPVILQGRLLFQEATKAKVGWDDELPQELVVRWSKWVVSLQGLSDLSFDRCLVPSSFLHGQYALHHFCDGSLAAYGTASYLRVTSPSGEVMVRLVLGKGRVAPLKSTTVPRLEMAAAVLAVRQDVMLRREMTVELGPSVFWSDSQVVLAYIANQSRRFKVFIANRVAFIHRYTEVSQWRHVPTKENPADVASRGCSSAELPDMWQSGPQFLRMSVDEWPGRRDSRELPCDDVELRSQVCANANVLKRDEKYDLLAKLWSYYDSLYGMAKALAWWRKFVSWLKSGRREISGVTHEDVVCAECVFYRRAQVDVYQAEVESLKQGKSVKRSSDISALDPVLEDGLLRVGGRLSRSSLSDESKRQIILPSQHPVTTGVLRQFHNKAHLGVNWTVSLVRRKFWVPKIKAKLKAVRARCITCKRLFAASMTQKMADLPSSRCTVGVRAFESVGVDVFGPFSVKQGRSVVKRYGCIFSCARVRAVHLEVLSSLDVDSFINALVRFTARRGMSSEFFSDNGTNFVGSVQELRREFAKLDKLALIRHARARSVQWSFNPPYASHFGGAWERLIRIVRRVLCVILNPKVSVSDEVLSTVMCEAECIVNSRPLTAVSDDVDDLSVLTPSHFLMSGSNYDWPWAGVDASVFARRRWRQVQAYMNMVWSRWLHEYLPELQRRQKWQKSQPSLAVGDLVLLEDYASPRGEWPLGRVLQVVESADGRVRSARVKVRGTELHRPVTKLVGLELAAVEKSSEK